MNIKKNIKYLSFLFFILSTVSSRSYAEEISSELIKKYAPIVKLHKDEKFGPSSVEFFFQFVDKPATQTGYITTKEPLDKPSTDSLSFFTGENVENNTVPIYAFVVPKPKLGDNITDVIYFTFYPFNYGKNVCIGWYSPWGCASFYQVFGNHVGDWEHAVIRFQGDTPQLIGLSNHGNSRAHVWGTTEIQMQENHPILYSAIGSHGLYESAGTFVYRKLPNEDTLSDKTSAGKTWETWHNLKVIRYQPKGTYSGEYEWMNFAGSWGNAKRGCEIVESVSGECVLNDGPTGPAEKSNADTNNPDPDDL